MKKNIVIAALCVVCCVFAYLGIKEYKSKQNLELELGLTQQALFASGKKLEELQYLDEWSGDPSLGKDGIYKYRDYYGTHLNSDEYRMRVVYHSIDIPLYFNNGKGSARIAESYEGFDWDECLIEFE